MCCLDEGCLLSCALPSEEVCGAVLSLAFLAVESSAGSVARADLPRAGGRGLTSTTRPIVLERTVRSVAARQKVRNAGLSFWLLFNSSAFSLGETFWFLRREPTSTYTYLQNNFTQRFHSSWESHITGWLQVLYINSLGAVTVVALFSY